MLRNFLYRPRTSRIWLSVARASVTYRFWCWQWTDRLSFITKLSGTGQSDEDLHILGLRQMGSLKGYISHRHKHPEAVRQVLLLVLTRSDMGSYAQDAVPRDIGVLTVWQECIQVQVLYSNHFVSQIALPQTATTFSSTFSPPIDFLNTSSPPKAER